MVHVSDALTGTAPVWAIRVESLTIRYRRRIVIAGLDWRIPAGKIAWVIGENGLGKSSLLRVLAGRSSPRAGRALVEGPPGERAERLYFHPGIRAPADIDLAAWLRFVEANTPAAVTAPGLLPAALDGRRRLETLSTGEAKRVLLAALLRRQTALTILDEPYEHLSRGAKTALTEALRRRAEHGVVVIATNQDVPPGRGEPLLQLSDDGTMSLRTGEAA
jgi:heme exporter protein A